MTLESRLLKAEKQLLQYRTDFIKNLYSGQPEKVVNSALRGLHLMEFGSIDDFNTWATSMFETDPEREASEEEINDAFKNMFPELNNQVVKVDTRTADEKQMDEIFKYL